MGLICSSHVQLTHRITVSYKITSSPFPSLYLLFFIHPARRPERSILIDRPPSHAEETRGSLGDLRVEIALLLLDVLRTGSLSVLD